MEQHSRQARHPYASSWTGACPLLTEGHRSTGDRFRPKADFGLWAISRVPTLNAAARGRSENSPWMPVSETFRPRASVTESSRLITPARTAPFAYTPDRSTRHGSPHLRWSRNYLNFARMSKGIARSSEWSCSTVAARVAVAIGYAASGDMFSGWSPASAAPAPLPQQRWQWNAWFSDICSSSLSNCATATQPPFRRSLPSWLKSNNITTARQPLRRAEALGRRCWGPSFLPPPRLSFGWECGFERSLSIVRFWPIADTGR